MATPTNTDNIIDSRDIIARIDVLERELEAEHDAIVGRGDTWQEWAKESALDDSHTMQDWCNEWIALSKLAEEASNYASNWKYGETLIRDGYFNEYAQAIELQESYTEVDFDGEIYWIRSS